MSTRISELPDIPDASQNGGYVQMNVHPNPYGNQHPQNVMMPPPQYTQSPPKLPNNNNYMLPDQQKAADMRAAVPQMQLPSRDIPMDMSDYTHDEQTTPNYIPPLPKLSKRDFILEDEDDDDRQREALRRKEKRARIADDVLVTLQRPMIVALLFFLFSTPFLNSVLSRYLTFLYMYNADGNITTWGITLKSVVFGAFVFGLDYLISE